MLESSCEKSARWVAGVRISSIVAALAAIVSCGSDNGATNPNTSPRPTPNFVRLVSDPGDPTGKGLTFSYDQTNALFRATEYGNLLVFTITADKPWDGNFTTLGADSLRAGTYANAAQDASANTPGLDWFDYVFECDSVSGSFTIDSSTYANKGLSTQTLSSIDLRFTQTCNGAPGALHGTIHWRMDDTTQPAGPVVPIPAGLWQPDPRLVPRSGNYVYLASDSGNELLQGQVVVLGPPTAMDLILGQRGSGSEIYVYDDGYAMTFASMNGTNPVKVGYYGNLQRYPYDDPVRGGFDIVAGTSGCNTESGWFAVDSVGYKGAGMTALDLRFEHHCDGFAPALHGAIHWRAP